MVGVPTRQPAYPYYKFKIYIFFRSAMHPPFSSSPSLFSSLLVSFLPSLSRIHNLFLCSLFLLFSSLLFSSPFFLLSAAHPLFSYSVFFLLLSLGDPRPWLWDSPPLETVVLWFFCRSFVEVEIFFYQYIRILSVKLRFVGIMCCFWQIYRHRDEKSTHPFNRDGQVAGARLGSYPPT